MTTSDRGLVDHLPEELAAWRREGLISEAQARRILARYGLTWTETDDARRQGRLSTVVSTLGAVLTGVGIILFVASNWAELGRLARLALLLVALLATSGLGYWAYRRDHPRVGAALVFLSALVFGANVFLVAQTYHVQAGNPSLLLLWALGAAATGYSAHSRPSTYLAVLCLVLWYIFQIAEWGALTRSSADRALAMAGFLPLGLLLLSTGFLHRTFVRLQPHAGAWVIPGMATIFGILLLFSFAELWRGLAADSSATGQSALAPIGWTYLGFSALALFTTTAISLRLSNRRHATSFGIGALVVGLGSLLVVFHPLDRIEAYGIAFNLLLLATTLWSVGLGIWTRQESLINLSLIAFALQVLARYFDFFFSLFDRSLVFIGAGILLLFGGWAVERSRRTLIARLREAPTDG